jgi:hypothetical protein
MSHLLEETGYSYSGISNIIHNEPEKAIFLITEIDKEYRFMQEQIAELEKELADARNKKALLVSTFIYAHKALKLGENPLCFLAGNNTIVVGVKDQNTIDYNIFRHSDFLYQKPSD